MYLALRASYKSVEMFGQRKPVNNNIPKALLSVTNCLLYITKEKYNKAKSCRVEQEKVHRAVISLKLCKYSNKKLLYTPSLTPFIHCLFNISENYPPTQTE